MPRSAEQVRLRLQQAALDLYGTNGYDSTTTAQIADRAGVTERTFFRHFPDKREILFDGEVALRADLEVGVAEAPGGLDPLAVLFHAFRTTLPLLRRNRAFSQPRQEVIAATPALRERALAKEAGLAEVLMVGLRRRGVEARQATLAGQIGVAAFTQALLTWFDHPEIDLADHLDQALEDLRTLGRENETMPRPAPIGGVSGSS